MTIPASINISLRFHLRYKFCSYSHLPEVEAVDDRPLVPVAADAELLVSEFDVAREKLRTLCFNLLVAGGIVGSSNSSSLSLPLSDMLQFSCS